MEEPKKEKSKEIVPVATHAIVAMGEQGLAIKTLDDAWRFAQFLAGSLFVPDIYKGKPGDCVIAIDISKRLGVAPLMFLQNSFVVNGKPGLEAKLVITLINQSGLFVDPLDYEVIDEDNPKGPAYKIRAFATRKSTGKVLYGPWITWATVMGEGWQKKSGSKWMTIPDVMYHYRAASWFKNRHCPEVAMGMMSVQELQDIAPEAGRRTIPSETLAGPTPTTERTAFGTDAEPAKDVAKPEPDTTEDEGGKDAPEKEVEQKPLNKNIDTEGTPTHVCEDCGEMSQAASDECWSCGKHNVVPVDAGPKDKKGGKS